MTQKQKQILQFLFHSDRGNIVLIVGVALMICLLWSLTLDNFYIVELDVVTYFYAGEVFANGDIDYLRTPIYPLICYAFHHIFGDKVFESLASLNIAVFLISIVYFYRTIALFTQRRATKFITTALYAWNILIAELCLIILAESITMSGIIYLLYLLSLIYVGKASRSTVWKASATLLFLILMRPFNVCFIPLVALVIVFARIKGSFKQIWTAIAAFSPTALILFGYCLWFKTVYGVFGFSYVSTVNTFVVVRNAEIANIQTTNYFSSEEIAGRKCFLWVWLDRENGKVQIEQVLKEKYIDFIKDKIIFVGKTCFYYFPFTITTTGHFFAAQVQSLYMGTIYIAILLLSIFEISLWVKKRRYRIDIIAFHLLLCITCIFTAIVGSADYGANRLAMPMFPSLCLLVGLFIEQTNLRFSKSVNPQYNFNKS